MKIIQKENVKNRVKLTIFGFIKISYKNNKTKNKIKIKNLGKNNFINNSLCSKNSFINGTGKFIIKGNNNKINIDPSSTFNNCHIEIWKDNVTLNIGKLCSFNEVYAVFIGSENGNTIKIGDKFWNTNDLQMFAGGNKNMDLEIGDNCMFARRIAIYAHDGHNIYDVNTKELVNIPKNSLKIGNHVWIGHSVHICKGTIIPDDTIIGMGSVVSGKFDKTNTTIAGNPAKIVKENVIWEK